MDEYGHNVITHSVKPRNEGSLGRKRALLIVGYVLFCLVYIGSVTIPVQLYPVLAGLPFFLYALVRITWWRLDYGYDYSLAHGELLVEKVYSASHRRPVCRLPLREAAAIAPLATVSLPKRAAVLDVRTSATAEGSYAILYRNAAGREAVLLLEVTEKMVRMMARFSPVTVVAEGLPA